MNVLQINNTDLPGARFNGYAVMKYFFNKGINCKQLVFDKYSTDENVVSFADAIPEINKIYRNFEKKMGIHGLVYPYANKIMKMKEFVEADVVHYHLIHNYILSLLDFPKLVSRKPSIWTIHDPWIFTGHCIYPMECQLYLSGCKSCNHLDRLFPLKEDNSSKMWQLKKNVFSKIDLDIVVASKWMLELINNSLLTRNFKRVHYIPFGVNLKKYKVTNERRLLCRQKLEIDITKYVIFFRSDRSEFKGLKYIKKMLSILKNNHSNIVLLTVGEIGLLDEFKGMFTIKDMGWFNDEDKIADLYAASDAFLMPSTAEAFGVMAIEAMASSLPVIVFKGTALPSVIREPFGGIALAKEDTTGFVKVMDELIMNPEKGKDIGRMARLIAEKRYNEKDFYRKLQNLYEDVSKHNNS